MISLIDIFFRVLETLSGSGGQFDEILRYLGCFVCLDFLLLPNWFELVWVGPSFKLIFFCEVVLTAAVRGEGCQVWRLWGDVWWIIVQSPTYKAQGNTENHRKTLLLRCGKLILKFKNQWKTLLSLKRHRGILKISGKHFCPLKVLWIIVQSPTYKAQGNTVANLF